MLAGKANEQGRITKHKGADYLTSPSVCATPRGSTENVDQLRKKNNDGRLHEPNEMEVKQDKLEESPKSSYNDKPKPALKQETQCRRLTMSKTSQCAPI